MTESQKHVGNVDPAVAAAAIEFSTYWSEKFVDLARFQLDFSWPSVTTIGLLLDYWPKDDNSRYSPDFVRGVSSYLGMMAAQLWQAFPVSDGKLHIKLSGDKITLEAKIDSKPIYSIDILPALEHYLANPDYTGFFPVTMLESLPHFSRIRRFALDLFSGLCPLGSGSWPNNERNKLSMQMVSLDMALAKSTAEYAVRVYPSIERLHNVDLYFSGVITPPAGFNDPTLLGRAAVTLSRNLTATIKDQGELAEVLSHLSNINEPQIATAALISALALNTDTNKTRQRRFRRAANSIQSLGSIIRYAAELTRKVNEKPGLSALVVAESDRTPEIIEIFARDSYATMSPLKLLGADEVRSDRSLALALYLGADQLILDKRPEDGFAYPSLEILAARAALNLEQPETVREILTGLDRRFPGVTHAMGNISAALLMMPGDMNLAQADYDTACAFYDDALACAGIDSDTKILVLYGQFCCHLLRGDTASASDTANEMIGLEIHHPLSNLAFGTASTDQTEVRDALSRLPFSTILFRRYLEIRN